MKPMGISAFGKGAITVFFGVALSLSVTSCSIVKVSPWQRGQLAKRVMLRDGSAAQSALDHHTYASKEGTAGGYGIGAGGCGCN